MTEPHILYLNQILVIDIHSSKGTNKIEQRQGLLEDIALPYPVFSEVSNYDMG